MSEAAATPPARRRSGPARSLSRERVVDAALEVMSTQGLDSVSFRTVAVRLGVDPKALYTYVSDKDDLLGAMFDRLTGQLDMPTANDPRPVVERLVSLLTSLRTLLIRYPDMYRFNRPLDGAWHVGDMWEPMMASLSELDPDLSVAIRIWIRLINYALGSAMYASRAFGLVAAPPEAIEKQFDASRHPHILQALDAEPFTEDDTAFAAAVRVMIEQRLGES